MIRICLLSLATMSWLLVSAAVAQEPPAAPAEDKPAAKPEEKPAAPPGEKTPAPAQVIDESEEVTFERRVGWYLEGRGGVFFTLAGKRGYSNAQPFYGFEFGYDITDRFSIQFGFGNGYQAANPLEYPENCTGTNCSAYHLDFGLAFFNISADYDIFYGRRWAFEVRAGGGVVLITPSAKPDQTPVDGDVFGGLRFEWFTLLRHFTLGLETDFYYVIPTNIPALSITVSILYNF